MNRPSLLLLAAALTAFPVAADATRVVASMTVEKHGAGATVLFPTPQGVALGISGFEFGGARWFYGTAGVTRRFSRNVIDLQADAGSVHETGSTSPYRIFRAAVVREIVIHRLWGEVEARRIDVASQHGNLLKGGVRATGRGTTLSTAVYASTGGNLEARYVTARVDRAAGRNGILVGGAAGRAAPSIFDQPGGPARRSRIAEVFAGVEPPMRMGRVQFVIDLLKTENVRRVRGIVTWTFIP